MTPSYIARLILLSSASFFVLQMVLESLVAWIAPTAIRRARTMRPESAARLLFALRLLPVALSALAVAALCIPSYLRFEPLGAEEEVGFACLAAAMLGASICALAIYRALGALIRSYLYVRRCGGMESRVEGETVWIVQQSTGLAQAGIVHPRLIISERAMTELSGDQLAVALRHEHAHRASRDNLKRLLILLAPSVFPRLRTLERAWIECAEWAADDRAAEGSAERSVALAAALIRVARLQSGIRMPPLATSLVDPNVDLSLRVDRLLRAPRTNAAPIRGEVVALYGAMILFVALIALNSSALQLVHRLLERLID